MFAVYRTAAVVVLWASTQVYAQTGTASQSLDEPALSESYVMRLSNIGRLQRAVSSAPDSVKAHIDLGMAYAAEYDPSIAIDGPDVIAWDRHAVREFKAVLSLEGRNLTAHKELCFLLVKEAEYDQADPHCRAAMRLDASDPAPPYLLAVSDFNRGYSLLMSREAERDIEPQTSLNELSTCGALRLGVKPRFDEAITLLRESYTLRADFETLRWLSDSYKVRSRLQCGDPAAAEADSENSMYWREEARNLDVALMHVSPERTFHRALRLPRQAWKSSLSSHKERSARTSSLLRDSKMVYE